MSQRVVSDRFPYLPLTVTVGQRSVDVEALLDTGSDGDVCLPAADLLLNGETPDYFEPWMLADESEILAPAFLGEVQVDGFPPFPAVITGVGDEPLVGRGVSDRFSITLDHGQRLIVEP